jgi:hypothetical protein
LAGLLIGRAVKLPHDRLDRSRNPARFWQKKEFARSTANAVATITSVKMLYLQCLIVESLKQAITGIPRIAELLRAMFHPIKARYINRLVTDYGEQPRRQAAEATSWPPRGQTLVQIHDEISSLPLPARRQAAAGYRAPRTSPR